MSVVIVTVVINPNDFKMAHNIMFATSVYTTVHTVGGTRNEESRPSSLTIREKKKNNQNTISSSILMSLFGMYNSVLVEYSLVLSGFGTKYNRKDCLWQVKQKFSNITTYFFFFFGFPALTLIKLCVCVCVDSLEMSIVEDSI